MAKNLFPIEKLLLSRDDKQAFLKQKSVALWFTGLSGSGKSTIAALLEKKLHEHSFISKVLDGDNIRSGLNANLDFSEIDRSENLRRIAEVNKLFLQCGIITINSFISPTNADRLQARNIIGDDFLEIFIDCPLKICEKRDVKGLYKKARKGEIRGFTGIDAPFEIPENPDLVLKTNEMNAEECAEKIYQFIKNLIKF